MRSTIHTNCLSFRLLSYVSIKRLQIPGLNCCLNSALEPRLAMCAVVSIS